MKKQLFAFAVAMGMALILSAGALAQNSLAISAQIPFEFTVNNTTLPAGTYQIAPAGTTSRAFWRISDASDEPGLFLLAGTLSSRGVSSGDLLIKFHRYGEKNFLVGFKTSSYEVDLPASKAEKSLRSATGKVAEKVLTNAGTGDVMSH